MALELARAGAAHGTTVVAEAQTAGRGRLGRAFFSPPRLNLYSSSVLRPRLATAEAPPWILASAVAVAEAVEQTVGDAGAVEIKWPNDVLLGGLKTSGILMELSAEATRVVFLVLGIGVNLNVDRRDFPEEFRATATSLASHCGRQIDRIAFAQRLYNALERALDTCAERGFEALRPRFEARFRMRGRPVTVVELDGSPAARRGGGRRRRRRAAAPARRRRARARRRGRRDAGEGERRDDAARDRHRQHQRLARPVRLPGREARRSSRTTGASARTASRPPTRWRSRSPRSSTTRSARRREVTDMIISSVVPPLLPIWERVSAKLFDRPALIVGPGIRTGMPVRYENPREVGADRIVNAVAAFEMFGGPVIAVDFGTATTFDCVSREGEYLGGAIFPGIHISMEALFERASMLHRVELARPKSVIGRTTTGGAAIGPALRLRGRGRRDGRADPRGARPGRARGRDRRPRAPRRRRDAQHRARRALPHARRPADHLREEPPGRRAPAKGEVRMKNVKVNDTHNFALVGHSGDGKTSLGEALLHAAGATPTLGRVDDGSSLLNYLPEEKERRHTITSSVFGFDVGARHVTLVDTPGDSNFQADGQIALHALDGAVLVCSAVGGAKVGTSRMWRACQRLGVPALAFVNGLDREHADFEAAVASLRELGAEAGGADAADRSRVRLPRA